LLLPGPQQAFPPVLLRRALLPEPQRARLPGPRRVLRLPPGRPALRRLQPVLQPERPEPPAWRLPATTP
jgi:hypothetical protein